MKRFLLIIVTMIFLFTNCAQQNNEKIITGPYFGQTPPGLTPEIFAPEFISTGLNVRDAAFTPDGKEFYFVLRGNYMSAIVMTKMIDGKWTPLEVAPFSGLYKDIEPFINHDGSKFYFVSNRPIGEENMDGKITNIWVMDSTGNGWSEPYPIGEPINGHGMVFFPTVAKSGNLYFTRRGENDYEAIYRSKFIDGKYTEPEKLPDNVNTTDAQFNSFISPDEDFLIIPVYGRDDSFGETDYYVTFRDENDNWSDIINLGDVINTEASEYSPSLTPDGKYFIYQSNEGPIPAFEKRRTYSEIVELLSGPKNGSSNLYWVSTELIHKLKP